MRRADLGLPRIVGKRENLRIHFRIYFLFPNFVFTFRFKSSRDSFTPRVNKGTKKLQKIAKEVKIFLEMLEKL